MAALNTTDIGGVGHTITQGAVAPTYLNPFKGLFEEVAINGLEETTVVTIKEGKLKRVEEGGHKRVETNVGRVRIIPSVGAHVEHINNQVLTTLAQEGEDWVQTMYRIVENNAPTSIAEWEEGVTVSALDAKTTTESTITLASAGSVFGVVAEASRVVPGRGGRVLAVSEQFANRILSATAADGRPLLRSLDEIPGVTRVIVFTEVPEEAGTEDVAYMFNPRYVKAATYADFSTIEVFNEAMELNDGTIRALKSRNEKGGLLEYSYGVGVGGDAGSVAKIVYAPAGE